MSHSWATRHGHVDIEHDHVGQRCRAQGLQPFLASARRVRARALPSAGTQHTLPRRHCRHRPRAEGHRVPLRFLPRLPCPGHRMATAHLPTTENVGYAGRRSAEEARGVREADCAAPLDSHMTAGITSSTSIITATMAATTVGLRARHRLPCASVPACPDARAAGAWQSLAPNVLSVKHCDRLLGSPSTRHRLASSGALLLRRTFAVDVLACPTCGGRLRVLGEVTEPAMVRLALESLGVRRCASRNARQGPDGVGRPARGRETHGRRRRRVALCSHALNLFRGSSLHGIPEGFCRIGSRFPAFPAATLYDGLLASGRRGRARELAGPRLARCSSVRAMRSDAPSPTPPGQRPAAAPRVCGRIGEATRPSVARDARDGAHSPGTPRLGSAPRSAMGPPGRAISLEE